MSESISLVIGLVMGFGLHALVDGAGGALRAAYERLRHPQRTVGEPVETETLRFTAPERRRFDPADYEIAPVCTRNGHAFTEGEVFYVWTVPPNAVLDSPEGELAVCEGHAYTGLTLGMEPRG